MNQNDGSERTSVRVPVWFPVRYKKLDDDAWTINEVESHRTCDRFGAPPNAFADLPADLNDLTEFQEMEPTVFRMWMTLERKLDHVIWLINRDTFEDPTFSVGRCIDLSAGGARLSITDTFADGERLLVRITPPTFPALVIEVVADVLRTDPDPSDEKRRIISITFAAINPYDREDLISYLFKRQREILRQGQDDR
jgi:hypothetical protein